MLLNLKLPGLSGLETLKYVCQLAPVALVIMLMAFGTMQDAVETMKLGAYDFIIKSVDLPCLDAGIARALEILRLRQRLADRTCDQQKTCHGGPVREKQPVRFDVHVFAAVNRRAFRTDLSYRVNGSLLSLPPLTGSSEGYPSIAARDFPEW